MFPLNNPLPKKRRTRTRGKVRVEQLLDAACDLLAEHELTELTFKDVYERAQIPPGSAYHFFDSIEALCLSLIDRFQYELMDAVSGEAEPGKISTWMDMVDLILDRVIVFYNSNAAARRILTQPGLHIGTIFEADKRSGVRLEEILDRYFVLPEIRQRREIFILATKIAHLLISISVTQYGKITEEMGAELKAAVKGYLKNYVPEMLTRRS